MILKTLAMNRKTWGPNDGKLEGTLTFANPVGEIQLVLDDEACTKILELCAEGLVRQAKAVAEDMTAAMITGDQMQLTQSMAGAE